MDALSILAEAAWNFTIATVVLAAITALILEFLNRSFAVLLRRHHLYLVAKWSENQASELRKKTHRFHDSNEPAILDMVKAIQSNPIKPFLDAGMTRRMFGLPFKQLAAQVALTSQAVIDQFNKDSMLLAILTAASDPETFEKVVFAESDEYGEATNKNSNLGEERVRLAQLAERNLDDLQIALERGNEIYDYVLGVGVSLTLGTLFLYANEYALRSDSAAVLAIVAATAGLLAPLVRDQLRQLDP